MKPNARRAKYFCCRHVSYLRALEGLLDRGVIKGLAHITGGGLLENIPRILPEATNAEIQRGSWPVLPVFNLLQRLGNIDESEMFRTFNMGIGMVVVCDPFRGGRNKKSHRIDR